MKFTRLRNLAGKAENAVAFLTVLLLAALPFFEVIARRFFKSGLANSTEYTRHLVLILTFLAAMITSRENRHLALNVVRPMKNDRGGWLNSFLTLLTVTFCTAFSLASLSFSLNGFDRSQSIAWLPIWLITLIMGLGYGGMALRSVRINPLENGRRPWPAGLLGAALGSFIALEPLVNVLIHLWPGLAASLTPLLDFSASALVLLAFPLIILLIVSAFLGVPIFVVLGGAAYLLFARSGQPLEIIPNEAYSMLTSHTLAAIPLFTFAGFILSESKAGERLVGFFRALFSWIPGGLAIMAILVSTFFTTFTGASGVTILALGALLYLVLTSGRYGGNFSSGLLTASGSVGLLFPPSLPIIIYGVTAQISIKDMFIGGLLPGALMVMAMIGLVVVYALRKKVEREPFRIKAALRGTAHAAGELMLPVVIVGAYFGGLTTLVESAALAVIYSLMLEVFIHRDLKLNDLNRVIMKSLPIIGGVLTILALAKGLSYFIVDAEIPMKLSAWVEGAIQSKYVFLLLLNLALLITGCFMDIFSAIMVVVPLILPLGESFGIHPVHLGIIFLANMELGYLTPPVGMNLFLSSYRFNIPVVKLYRHVLPFFLLQLITVLLITYLPFISTALLGVFG